jgi:hypothetical protein
MRWDKMDKYFMELIIQEVRNFDKLKDEYNYGDVDDLIAHYIEEEIITTNEELMEVLKLIKHNLGIVIDQEVFQ